MTLKIYDESNSEWVDITPYIAYGGLNYQKDDIDGPAAGRLMSGEMFRARVAEKHRLDVTCHVMTAADYYKIRQLIRPEVFYVQYDDTPGEPSTWKMYSNNFTARYWRRTETGVDWWTEFEFPLIQI